MLIAGETLDEFDEKGQAVKDDTLLILLNSYHESVSFSLPVPVADAKWQVILDTTTSGIASGEQLVDGKQPLEIAGRSVVMLRMHHE
jgi:glycogen operon protein